MAWNTWGEPNYIYFEGNRLISSSIVFFSPYFMPLLFLLAGISTRFALQKRTYKEYILLNTITKYVSEWVMVIALIGLGKWYLDFSGKVSGYRFCVSLRG